MKQDNFDASASLKQIEEMISQARRNVEENGFLYRLWGWAVVVCALIHFGLAYSGVTNEPYWVWCSLLLVFIFQFFYIAKRERKRQVKTFADRLLGTTWLVFSVMIALALFMLICRGYYDLINPVMLLLYGMPTILSGVLLKTRSLVWGGLCCFALAIIAVFVPML